MWGQRTAPRRQERGASRLARREQRKMSLGCNGDASLNARVEIKGAFCRAAYVCDYKESLSNRAHNCRLKIRLADFVPYHCRHPSDSFYMLAKVAIAGRAWRSEIDRQEDVMRVRWCSPLVP